MGVIVYWLTVSATVVSSQLLQLFFEKQPKQPFTIFLRLETGALAKLGIHGFYAQIEMDFGFARIDTE